MEVEDEKQLLIDFVKSMAVEYGLGFHAVLWNNGAGILPITLVRDALDVDQAVYLQQHADDPQDVPQVIMPSSAVPMDIVSEGTNSAPPSPPKKRRLSVWCRDVNGNPVQVSSCVCVCVM